MKKLTLLILTSVALITGCVRPPSDASVAAIAETCKAKNMAAQMIVHSSEVTIKCM